MTPGDLDEGRRVDPPRHRAAGLQLLAAVRSHARIVASLLAPLGARAGCIGVETWSGRVGVS